MNNHLEEINSTTWKHIAKDDPKDRLEIEIGDEKQSEFFPQVKIKRWDNECNFSVRLKDTETGTESFSKDKERILWDKGNLNIEFYDTEDAFKFVWYLKAKPVSNKVEFTIQSKDVKFLYQPELTQKEKDDGAVRPENVVGSYAVYHTSKGGMNDINGMSYKAGKIGHIYRPHLYDSNGLEAWGILHIENGIYSVEIPQEFLDKAVYPIKSNDTFGYEETGATTSASSAGTITGTLAALSEIGTVASFSAYVKSGWGTGGKATCGLFDSDGKYLSKKSVEVSGPKSNNDWVLFSISSPFELSIDSYLLTMWSNIGITWGADTGSSGNVYDSSGQTYPTWPASITHTSSYIKSIYATYTPSGGGTTENATFFGSNF